MIDFINLTPHAISIELADGEGNRFTVAPSGTVARVEMEEVRSTPLYDEYGNDFIQVIRRTAGTVTGIPPRRHRTVLLVSSMVLDAMRDTGRCDVYAPDTGASAIRENGQVIAVRRLVSSY